MPGGCVPMVEFDDKKRMGETVPIMRFLAYTHGYFPKDPQMGILLDEIVDAFYLVFPNIGPTTYIKDEEEK